MKNLKKIIFTFVLIISLGTGNIVKAGGIPVIDVANLAENILQIVELYLQYEKLVEQYVKACEQYDSLNGIRGMADLVNNPELRQYLPEDYQTILDGGYGNWESIRDAYKKLKIEDTPIGTDTDTAKAYEETTKQAAVNRATAEDAYSKASQRFTDIQTLLDKVNDAPDAKDIADLQARIQAEQVMMQNENIKLAMLTQLQKAQSDLSGQQINEIRAKDTNGEVSRF
jgi:type IV secretion system protein VirB5